MTKTSCTVFSISRPISSLRQSSSLSLGGWSGKQGGLVVQFPQLKQSKKYKGLEYKKTGICRAGLEDDAPFAIAISACMLSTLLLPVNTDEKDDKDRNSTFGADDVRYTAMGIISFIPLFNWLAWVFAWLDTSKQRYLVYAIVYLAPYLRTGLSVSPEESWLPLASVLACIVHIQLDITVNSEGGRDSQLPFENVSKIFLEGKQAKQLKESADTFLLQLRRFGDRNSVPPTDENIDAEEERLPTAEEVAREEMEKWDEQLANTKVKHASADHQEDKTDDSEM